MNRDYYSIKTVIFNHFKKNKVSVGQTTLISKLGIEKQLAPNPGNNVIINKCLNKLVRKNIIIFGNRSHTTLRLTQKGFDVVNSGKYMDRSNRKAKNLKTLPRVVILTAIREEYDAIRHHLFDVHECDENDSSYDKGLFIYNGNKIAEIVFRECGGTNVVAAQEAERSIIYFKPDCLFFVGIAGSRKPSDFGLGDVIFPSKIYSYEGGKSESDAFKSRPDLIAPTYTLYELAKRERRKEDWKVLLKNRYSKKIKAEIGVIASGEQLVEHYSSSVGAILSQHFDDTSAVEMEGFGFAKAATRQGRETSGVKIAVFRGISDILTQDRKPRLEGAGEEKRPRKAKEKAANSAAAFAFWLIYKLYSLKEVTSKSSS